MTKNIKSIFLLSITNIVVGVLNYIYHPVLLNYLSLKDFGEIEVLLSIINIFGIFFSSISLFLIKEIAITDKKSKIKGILNYIFNKLIVFGILFYLIFLLASPLIGKLLKIDNIYNIILCGSVIFFMFLNIYKGSFFKGKKHFRIVALSKVLDSIMKLSLGFIFVYLGLSVFGALSAVVISKVILLIIGVTVVYKITKDYPKPDSKKVKEIRIFFKNSKKHLGKYVFGNILLAIIMNLDIIFAKAIFDENTAGIYAAISIIAKFVIVISLSIEMVFYPDLVKRKKVSLKNIAGISSLYLIIAVSGLLFFYIFGEYVLDFFGKGLENYTLLLYLLIIYSCIISILSLFVKLLISFKEYSINFVLALYFGLLVVSINYLIINSVYDLAYFLIILAFILLSISFYYLIRLGTKK